MNDVSADPHHLKRFVEAQEDTFQKALAELRAGEKRSHWMWYIFPQFAGLGNSPMAQHYAICSRIEAEAYLLHPILGPRLVQCAAALLGLRDRSVTDIMGKPDDLKLRSCMTLFAELSEQDSIFHHVLDRYFSGETDTKTLEFLRREASGPV